MKTKTILFRKFALALLTLFCVNESNAQSNLILQKRIAASSDDAEERGLNATSNPGLMDLTSSDIELVRDGNDGDQYVGLRFTNINIPKNAIIDSVFIQFTVDETDNGATSVTIKAEDVDSSSTFVGINNNISSRATTTDSVNWTNIPAWNTRQVATLDQRTPDLKILLESIIGRAGWIQGNPITFIITGTGERTAESFDGVLTEAAELIVHYAVPKTKTFNIINGNDDAEENFATGAMNLTSTDLEFTTDGTQIQVVGMRFQNVSVPKGSTILDARIQFEVDEVTTTDTVNIAFDIEGTDDAAVFTNTNSDISNRPFTLTQAVLWTMVPAWDTIQVAGNNQLTPDLSNLVQNVVNRSGWVSGNALVFGAIDPSELGLTGFSTNAGKRTAESFNGSSTGAAKLIIEYIEPATFVDGEFPISKFSSWKYNDLGVDLSLTNWVDSAFNDSTWQFGDAILGYGNSNETTTVSFGDSANNKHITTYLRHTFNSQDVTKFDSLIFHVLRDDGVVVYVNGQEVFRQNMPGGTIGFNTTASSAVGGANETTYFRTAVANTLINGRNVIAVELHQAAATSSDLSFDMEVTGKLPPLATSSFPINSGDAWNFLDDGSDILATNWKDLNFNDTVWSQGKSPLGYGDPAATTLSFGSDPQNKHVTYYFRKRFDVANLSNLKDTLLLSVRRDDGAIVHINGTEVFRTNMPAGSVNFRTTSSTIVSGGQERQFFNAEIPKTALNQGVNVIAIQVHQRDSLSSDLMLDVRLIERPDPPVARSSCLGPNDTHISCYTSLLPSAQGPSFFIPETHAFQVMLEHTDAYTNQTVRTTVPGNHDFTGYVGRNGSSIDGFLSINHENTPGGVSILDLRYIDSTRLWTVDSSEAVDLYNSDLVTTTRNCGGGITPWGTIITSEETTNAGDANSDGYEDVGWHVEIDPVTKRVKEYGTPGKQEKLWAMGRMSHENIVIANDSLTAYQGEDRGTGAVYKFVANNKMDLSSGTLYALQIDGGLTGSEPTNPTGKWIPIPNATQADRNTTNSLAITLGATLFNGVEDVEISPLDGKVYFTAKGFGKVYRFSDDSDTTLSQFETFVGGASYQINHGNGITTEPWSGGNDNLAFDDLGNLYVLQDGDRDHIWMVAPDHTQANPKVDLFAKLPAGSEPSGMTFTPDFKFMFISIMHPSGANSSTTQEDAAGRNINMSLSATLVIARKEFLGSYEPTAAPTNLVFNTSACDTIGLTFNAGNGNGRIVVAKEASVVDEYPLDGTTYIADNVFGNGTDLGQGNFVVFDGTDSLVTINGLKQNTTYHVSIFEYNEDPTKFYERELAPIDSSVTAVVATSAISGNTSVPAFSSQTYTVTNTVGSTYSWDAGAATINSGQGTNQIQVTLPSGIGAIDLKVLETNNRGCEGDTILKIVDYGLVGIEEFDLKNAISIAPNPSNGRITLKLNGTDQSFDLVITDLLGKVILDTRMKQAYEIDLSNQGKGTYILRLSNQFNIATKKLIVQ